MFTAFADICLGAAAAGYFLDRTGVFAIYLLLASGCLYSAGMVFNDFFDRREDAKARPFRPIPSGRIAAVDGRASRQPDSLVGVVGLGGARGKSASTVDALRLVQAPPAIAGLLAAAILLYDAYLKRTPLGPLGMGACRFLNVLLGLSGAGTDVWTPPNLHLAAAVGVYIVGVTWFARTEEGESSRRQLRLASLVMLVGVLLGLTVPVHFEGRTAPVYFPYLVAAFLFWSACRSSRPSAGRSRSRSRPRSSGPSSGWSCSTRSSPPRSSAGRGCSSFCCCPPRSLLGKWVYST